MSFRIPLIKPYITDKLKQRVLDVLDSGYLTEGPVTRELEERLGSFLKSRYCLAATSCTTGLEMALRAVKIGPGDEVIVPAYTYPATAGAVAIVGALPVIVDVDPTSGLMDITATKAALTPATRALMPVSLFGNPLDYDQLNALKREHELLIIEDAACSIGAQYKGAMVGTMADISVFSLHPRKFITTGEGGMVATKNREWHEWMLSYKHFGMGVSESRLLTSFERMGTNYKLSNLQAAVGLAQMEDAQMLLDERRALAARYGRLMESVAGAQVMPTTKGGIHSYQTYCVLVQDRDRIMASMRQAGIEAQIGSYLLPAQPAFQSDSCRLAGPFPGAEQAFNKTLALPLFHAMSKTEQEEVVATLAGLI